MLRSIAKLAARSYCRSVVLCRKRQLRLPLSTAVLLKNIRRTVMSLSSSSSPSDDFVFRDRLFESRDVPDIPRDFRPTCDPSVALSIDYARRSEVTSSLRDMLKMANGRGDNVGCDEFEFMSEDDGNHRKLLSDILVEYSTIFTVRFATCIYDVYNAYTSRLGQLNPSSYKGVHVHVYRPTSLVIASAC